MTKNKKPKLEDIMDSISYEDSSKFNESQLQDEIRKQMPGYTIQTWDLDQYQTAEIFGSLAEELAWPVEQGKQFEDIQYVEEWCTDECDAYFCILAYKLKEE